MRTGPREAELVKLAHALGRPVSELEFLDGVPAEDLGLLRAQISAALFDADRAAFEKVAGLARLIPAALAAKVAEIALQPLVAARVAEALDRGRAVELAARMSDSYLADVAAVLDPARAADIVGAIPSTRVGTVTRELARRGQWVVIGALLSYVSPEALRAGVAVLGGAQLLRASYVVEDPDRLDEVAAALSGAQIGTVLAAAATGALWSELDVLVCACGPEVAARFRERLSTAPQALRAAVDGALAAGALSAAAGARLAAK